LLRTLAVALVDVVMETPHAGLDFCRFVRDVMQRQSVQLIIRTGQAGLAPPRKIIDDLNISGYLSKHEATGERLYVEMKSAIQRHYDSALAETWATATDLMRETCTTADELASALKRMLDTEFGHGDEFHIGYDFFGERYIGGGDMAKKSDYDQIIGELMERGKTELDNSLSVSYYGGKKHFGSKKGVAVTVPNRVAQVDDYVIVQTSAIGRPRDQLATMVMKNPVYPRRLLWFYGPCWRGHFSWLAQVMTTA
jgi:hypothetical protein